MSDVRAAAFRRIRELTDGGVGEDVQEIHELASQYASARESVEEKGRRLLIEGRLTVEEVDDSAAPIVASCKGDSGEVYRLGYDRGKQEWRCTCPKVGRTTRCSHLVALQLVTVRP